MIGRNRSHFVPASKTLIPRRRGILPPIKVEQMQHSSRGGAWKSRLVVDPAPGTIGVILTEDPADRYYPSCLLIFFPDKCINPPIPFLCTDHFSPAPCYLCFILRLLINLARIRM